MSKLSSALAVDEFKFGRGSLPTRLALLYRELQYFIMELQYFIMYLMFLTDASQDPLVGLFKVRASYDSPLTIVR